MSAAIMPRPQELAPRSYSSDDITVPSPDYASPQMHAPQIHHQPFRSLRARRAQNSLTLPLHLRRRTTMDSDSWMQSISDVEVETQYGRNFCYGMPKFDRTPLEQHHSYTNSPSALETSQSPSISGAMYGATRLPAIGFTPSYSYNSPGWQPGTHPLDLGGVSSAPMSAVWPQGSYAPNLPDTSVSLPSTPATIGLYQSPCQDQTSRQMPHLNTPPTSALSRSKMNSNGNVGKPELKVETGSHGYFKENSSVIMNKWFSNTTSQIAPPQLYNVPPPVPLSSQETFNDISCVSSDRNIHTTVTSLHPARSDFSSQLSFTSAGDFSSQSPQACYTGRRRLPNNLSPSPSFLRGPATQNSGGKDSPSGDTSLAPSTHDSDSNYAASSAQPSSHQPSRLPSPAASDHHYYNENNDKDAQNAFLIEARAKGMSYKEIKAKGGFNEAESTLRGRHRMLTKDKESRVRKPEWTETDIELLKKAVRVHTRGSVRSGKTSWKKVAEHITENGGSYSFGYATCHTKWKELHAGRRR